MDAPTIAMAKVAELETREPFKGLFRSTPDMIDAIAESMRVTGFDPTWPIAAWGGVVVDGHTRLAAAKRARISVVPVAMHHFADEADAIAYAIACQRNRRNFTDAELSRCVSELGKRGRGRVESNPQPCGLPPPPTAAQVAETLGISERKVEQIRTIADHAAPEVRTALARGDISVNAAYKATQGARKAVPVPDATGGLQSLADALRNDGGTSFVAGCIDCVLRLEDATAATKWDTLTTDNLRQCLGALGGLFAKMQAAKASIDTADAAPRSAQGTKDASAPVTCPDTAPALPAPLTAIAARYRDQLWMIASAKPREDWPAVREAMKQVAAMLDEGGAP
jgi:ParB family chromosome partitioning protein